MNDRFALAFMFSLGMHALLLGLVAVLGLPPAGREESSARTVIPVSLFEAGSAPASPAPGEGSGGQPHPDLKRSPAPTPSAPAGPAAQAAATSAPLPRSADRTRNLPESVDIVEHQSAVPPAPAAELRDSRQEWPAAPDLTAATANPSPAGAQASDDIGGHAAAPGAGAVGAAPGLSGGDGGEGQGQDPGGGTSGQGDVLIPGEFLAGNAPPRYPLLARRKGWEGTVVIEIHVSGSGRVEQARVEKSSGYAILDGAALGAIRSWRIALNGRLDEVDLRFRIPVIFKLREA